MSSKDRRLLYLGSIVCLRPNQSDSGLVTACHVVTRCEEVLFLWQHSTTRKLLQHVMGTATCYRRLGTASMLPMTCCDTVTAAYLLDCALLHPGAAVAHLQLLA